MRTRGVGESTRGGLFPLSLGGLGGLQERKFLTFERFYVRFSWGFYAFGTRFYSFWSQRYFLSHEKLNAGQNCFQTITCCCCFFTVFLFRMFL